MNIDVVNDPVTSKRVTDLFSKAQYDKQLPDYVQGEDRSIVNRFRNRKTIYC